MASATADLQRDLGGAIMQSLMGVLLTAGYASAATAAIAGSSKASSVTTSVQSQLTKSFSGADAIAQQYPQYSSQIVAAAKQSFVEGQDWAYGVAIIAVALGAVLVWFMFPKAEEEQRMLAEFHQQDEAEASTAAPQPAGHPDG
jgi:hypothetical protein